MILSQFIEFVDRDIGNYEAGRMGVDRRHPGIGEDGYTHIRKVFGFVGSQFPVEINEYTLDIGTVYVHAEPDHFI